MKPDDAHGLLPPDRRPFRVFIIAGSNRHQYSCPGVEGKARTLAWRVADRLPQDWEIDLEDLAAPDWRSGRAHRRRARGVAYAGGVCVTCRCITGSSISVEILDTPDDPRAFAES